MSSISIVPAKDNWVFRLPDTVTQFLLGVYLIASQWNPCDSISVAIGGSLFLIVLGIALGLFTALDRMLDEQTHRISLQWKLLVVGFFVWLGFATYNTYGQGNMRTAMLGFWQSVSMLGFVSSFYHQATKAGRLESMLRWMLGTVAGTVAYALYQYLYAFPRMRAEFQLDPNRFLADQNILPGSEQALQWQNRIMSYEPLGPFALTNSLAGFVGPWFVVIIAVIVWILVPGTSDEGKKSANSREWLRKFPAFFLTLWVLAIGSATVLILTKSRSAWLATIVTSLVLFIGQGSIGRRSWDRMQNYRSALAPVLLLIGIVGFFLLWRDPLLLTEASKSLDYRLQYWRGAYSILEKSPWLGVGPLNFQDSYPMVKEITASETPLDPHNLWAEIAVWGGIPALIMGIAMGAGLLQLFALNLTRESSEEAPPKTIKGETGRTSLLAGDFGASFGLVGVLALTLLFADIDTKICAGLFVAAAFYTASSLTTSSWSKFVQRNQAKIGFILCVFMSIHLFFAGGWMQPGNMNTLLIGAALGFASARTRPARSEDLHEWSPWIPLVTWGALAIVFATTTYIPETRFASWEADYAEGRWNGSGVSDWEGMISLHKYAPELPAAVSRKAAERILSENLGEKAKQDWLSLYQKASVQNVERSPQSWGVKTEIAERDMRLADFFGTKQDPGKSLFLEAAKKYSEAANLNPVGISSQLQAAISDYAAGDRDNAHRRLNQVQLIDESTPHEDKKLARSTVYIPTSLRTQWNLPPEAILGNDGLGRGEPVFQRLRTLLPKQE